VRRIAFQKARAFLRTTSLKNARVLVTRKLCTCLLSKKPRFQRVLFPEGLVFDGESYRTATTCLAFSYLQGFSEGNSSLASQSIPSWNQIVGWLKEMETFLASQPEHKNPQIGRIESLRNYPLSHWNQFESQVCPAVFSFSRPTDSSCSQSHSSK
jgi:hypothetical protein